MRSPRRDLPPWLSLALVVAAAASVFTFLEVRRGELWCVDGYYHIRSAWILGTEGISRTFPWWQETFLRSRWADKDFLYHLLLIPFTFGNLVAGAQAAGVVFATATIATFHEVLRRLSVPRPAVVTLALMAFSPALVARLAYPRSFVLAIALALAGTAAILLGKHRAAAGIAAAYAWSHISFHVLPGIALVHDLLTPTQGRRSFRTTLWTLGGMAAGVVVNPYFPNNLRLWWVQIVHVLTLGWASRDELRLGQELIPPDPVQLAVTNAGIYVVFLAALGAVVRARRASPAATTVLVVAAGFLALTFRSSVFLEFGFPYAMLFAALVLRDRGIPAWGRPALVAAVIVSVGLAARTATRLVELTRLRTVPDLWGAAAYLRDHVPDGETVFHANWDDFPLLYVTAPELRYIVGLDPTFMLATDAAKWRLYDDVGYGRIADTYAPIRNDFRSRYALVTARDPDLFLTVRRDPRFVERYADAHASVFELVDDDAPALTWRIGAASASGPGFIDLARAVSTRCAVATSTLPGPGRVTIGIASDDEIRVLVGDVEVYARSPLRTPRAGSPGGPPLDLGELDRVVLDTAERKVDVHLRDGSNPIVVEDCRLGDDFGFFLRASPQGQADSSESREKPAEEAP